MLESTTPCQCPKAGHCPARNRRVSPRGWRVCRSGDARAIATYFRDVRESRGHDGVPRLAADLFVTNARLMLDAQRLVSLLPPSIDAVIGIARSGLLPASLVAAQLHVPLYSASPNSPPILAGCGRRIEMDERQPTHAAIIDDTTASGKQMRAVAALVRAAFPTTRITTAVTYANPAARFGVDVAAAILPGPHYLEWNFWNCGHATHAAFDFDGILCVQGSVDPLYLPRRKEVPLIVTGRSEASRAGSAAWLEKHAVKYHKMIMRPADVSDDEKDIARWKGRVYRTTDLKLFVESEPEQSELIAAVSGKPVLCPRAEKVFRPLGRDEKCRKCATCGGMVGRVCGGCRCGNRP